MRRSLLHILLFALLILSASETIKAQTQFKGKLEATGILYESRLVYVDPGPNWKGYSLPDDANGIGISFINGLSFFRNRLFTGIGISFVRFERRNGASAFAEIEYLPLKGRVSPLLSGRFGYHHIWDQYQNGTGTTLLDFGAGVNIKLTSQNALYLRSGVMIAQQISFVPLSAGLRFGW